MGGRKFGVLKGRTSDKNILEVVPTAQFVYLDDYVSAFAGLRNKVLDGFAADNLVLRTNLKYAREFNSITRTGNSNPHEHGVGPRQRGGRYLTALSPQCLTNSISCRLMSLPAMVWMMTSRTMPTPGTKCRSTVASGLSVGCRSKTT